VPDFVDEASGKGKVESFTLLYDRNGEVEHGVVMLRTEPGTRTLARIPAQDAATLTRLTSMNRTPVGSLGEIAMAADGVPEWKMA
jgi:acetyl-CoA C-acetyltransferase